MEPKLVHFIWFGTIMEPNLKLFCYGHKNEKPCKQYSLQGFVVNWYIDLVGMTGFEPATPRPPGVYATRLRYIPNDVLIYYLCINYNW